jgi:hypothetical protein
MVAALHRPPLHRVVGRLGLSRAVRGTVGMGHMGTCRLGASGAELMASDTVASKDKYT